MTAHIENTPAPSPKSTFGADFLASLVVFLVALPLCMGIAKACGVPTEAGLLTGIIGGIIVGSLAGCPLQVSGPAAGLIVLVQDILGENKDDGMQVLAISLVLAGAIQLTAGLLRLGQWFRAVSPAVIEGMLAGIGVVIIAKQFHIMVDGHSEGGVLQNLLAIPAALYSVIWPAHGETRRVWPLLIGLMVIGVLILWRPLMPKRLRFLPAAFPAVILAVIVVEVLHIPAVSNFFPGPEVVKTIEPLPGPGQMIQNALAWPALPDLWQFFNWQILEYALTIAFVASAETLLCATAVDQMSTGVRTRYDRELAAQGVGNMLCGFLHALPMTGVIVRSKANVEAGAKTRLSAILHGFWLLVCVGALSFLLERVPTCSLAAILVYTGFRLINLKAIKELREFGWSEVGIYLATLGGVVSVGLLEGVVLGIILATIKLVYTFSHLAIRLEKDPVRGRTVMYLEGAATFIRLPQLAQALETIEPNTELHVHFEELRYIDHACLELLLSWEKKHEATGGSLVIDWEKVTAKFHPYRNGNGQKPGEVNGVPVPTEASRAQPVGRG